MSDKHHAGNQITTQNIQLNVQGTFIHQVLDNNVKLNGFISNTKAFDSMRSEDPPKIPHSKWYIYLWYQMLSLWQVHTPKCCFSGNVENYLSGHIMLLVTQFLCWIEMFLCWVCLCHFHQFTVTDVSNEMSIFHMKYWI